MHRRVGDPDIRPGRIFLVCFQRINDALVCRILVIAFWHSDQHAFGSITGNTAGTDGNGWGGGVYIMNGTFDMKGGSITDNHAPSCGGVVLSDRGNFRVSGAPTITGNTQGDDRIAANVWLSTGKTITNGGLTGGSIGVTLLGTGQEDADAVTILTGSSSNLSEDWFSSDTEGYAPVVEGTNVVLRAEGQGGQGVAEATEEGYITRAGLAVKVHGHAPFGLSGQTSGSAASVFTDVGDCSDTQLNAIGVLYDRQILGGASQSMFNPEGTVTRAAAAVVIWRAAGSLSNTETVTVPYSDVNTTQWYSAAIHCLYAIGVLDESDADSSGNFRINDNATVEDIEKWLGKYTTVVENDVDGEKLEDISVPGGTTRVDYVLTFYQSLSASNREEDEEDSENPNGTPFVDISGCTPAQQEAITYFYSIGVINGTTETTFDPYAAASNAQVATLLYRYNSVVGGGSQSAQPQTASVARSGGDNWYQAGVDFLVEEGVLTETEATYDAFNPHAPSLTEKVSAWSEGIKPNAPVISPAGGRYSSSQTVTITADAGLTIHYTTDGSVPTRDSAVYTGPITVGSDMVIQAMAVGDGLASDVVTARYTFGSGSSNSDSGSSSSSSSSTTTTTERNPDGSTHPHHGHQQADGHRDHDNQLPGRLPPGGGVQEGRHRHHHRDRRRGEPDRDGGEPRWLQSGHGGQRRRLHPGGGDQEGRHRHHHRDRCGREPDRDRGKPRRLRLHHPGQCRRFRLCHHGGRVRQGDGGGLPPHRCGACGRR